MRTFSVIITFFQSTPPHRWRLKAWIRYSRTRSFQSTPPHRWRHSNGSIFTHLIALSIHSTTQVETSYLCYPDCERQLSIHSTTQVETFYPIGLISHVTLSIHSTTQVETAISYNIIQDFLLISNKLTIISYIYHQFLLHILSITIPFCIFFWCESPWNFMFA